MHFGGMTLFCLGGKTPDEHERELSERLNPERNEMDKCYLAPLLPAVLEDSNLRAAAGRVIENKGAPGADGMTVDQLLPYLEEHGAELVEKLRNGQYWPKPVRRKEIPKPGGGVRCLGVPNVIDRMIQQAIAQVLTPIFEPIFSDHSYGFRPLRSAHDAVRKAKSYFDMGYEHVVDIDLQKYFDTLNHDLLMRMLREEITDLKLLSLIRKFLKGGVLIDGLFAQTTEGAIQGGPLSPLLSNIYLTKFDKLLEKRGHKFVRYADDCNIYVKSQRAAERVMRSCTHFLEGELKLTVNKDKSQVGSPVKLKFLGFAMWKIGDKSGIRIHEKSEERFKDKVRLITKRNRGRSVELICWELKQYLTGWLGYYRLASLKSKASKWDSWIRAKLRAYIWKQWKRVKTRYKNLRSFGVHHEQAYMWANTRKGYWRTSHSQILCTTLTNDYLESRGFASISKMLLRHSLKK
jgi:group II intron reverse transcriptase/maturase